jgi:hypothetical protein
LSERYALFFGDVFRIPKFRTGWESAWHASDLWMRSQNARGSPVALSQDLALGSLIIPLSGEPQLPKPVLPLRSAVDVPPSFITCNLTNAGTRHLICPVVARSTFDEARHFGVNLGCRWKHYDENQRMHDAEPSELKPPEPSEP